MAPYYPAYPIVALLSSVLVLIPLPWHLEASNVGTCLYMVWTSLACMNWGLNSIVWRSDAINRAPVWCDISSRVVVATSVALPVSSLCILRRLHKIISAQTLSTKASRRKDAFIDLTIGAGIPLLQIVMQYIVSGHRFDIFEEIGCYPFTYNTPLAYPLSTLWPILIGLVSAVYAVLILCELRRRSVQLAELLPSTSSLTAHRYLRLMLIAIVEILCTIPIASYGMYLNLGTGTVRPWISWADTHYNWSAVNLYPSVLWRADRLTTIAIELSRWLPILCALLFFAFFGFAEEARKHYRQAFVKAATFLGFRRRPTRGVLPLSEKTHIRASFLPRPATARKHASSPSTTYIAGDESKNEVFITPSSSFDSTSHTLTNLPSPSSASTLITFPDMAARV